LYSPAYNEELLKKKGREREREEEMMTKTTLLSCCISFHFWPGGGEGNLASLWGRRESEWGRGRWSTLTARC
jgi:hypothetical protein